MMMAMWRGGGGGEGMTGEIKNWELGIENRRKGVENWDFGMENMGKGGGWEVRGALETRGEEVAGRICSVLDIPNSQISILNSV
jgi:hypothetical protein